MGKRKFLAGIMALVVFVLAVPIHVKAQSSVIQFSTKNEEVQKGTTVTVVCQVSSSSAFVDASFSVAYDDSVLEFVSGGSKVSGGGGVLVIASTGNAEETNKMTFSLQFKAKKKGVSIFSVAGTTKVTDIEGTDFSVSSNSLSVSVVKEKKEVVEEPTPTPVITPEPVLDKNNKLETLETTALTMKPVFSAETKEYTATVDCDTEVLYFNYRTESKKARVQVLGNENLRPGENEVQIVVTAENGKKRKYSITVTKETQTETEKRLMKEEGEKKDAGFSIVKKKAKIILKNEYKFEVLDASKLKNVPAGYIQSSIELNGISVPAFTMENDLDNNYLLLYLKGPSGEKTIYQFDREEKTLQRYTGNMIEKVNNSAGKVLMQSGDSGSNMVFYVIIIGLIVIILCLMIAMLKMELKRRARDKKSFDELDL